ncbi:MAG: hypothetical protein IJM59_05180 [Proteobacteria bacterium]|nr:hypothetical protein [Pseudomonadota bacterium]
MTKNITDDDAREVIKILDKILAKKESIHAISEKARKFAQSAKTPEKQDKRAASLIIMHYSNLCAVGGGASAIPGIIPGVGLIYSLLGTGAVDAFLVLKFELEMSLALADYAGFDISDPRERKIAFLLACSALEEAYDVEKEPTLANILDLAISEYSSRELSKGLAKGLARALMLFASKRWTKFFPVIGIGIEASVNKVLSTRLGNECWRAIKHRRDALRDNPEP